MWKWRLFLTHAVNISRLKNVKLVAPKVALDRLITACIGFPCHCHFTKASYTVTDLPPEATQPHHLIASLNKQNAFVRQFEPLHPYCTERRFANPAFHSNLCSMSTYRVVTTPTLTNICAPHRVEEITRLYLLRHVAASTDAIFRESVYCNSLLNTSRQWFHNRRRVTRH